ncbi:MAG: hypothetical protein V4850_16395 [Myxococcota bacterium]
MSPTATDPEHAPWWPELLAIKDETTYTDLATRFGVTVYAIRKALERTNETKVSLPRGPKASGEKSPADPLAAVRDRLGTASDAEIAGAAAAGLTVEMVRDERKRLGISRFRRAPDGADVQPELKAPTRTTSTIPAPTLPAPVAVDPIDAYAHQLGKVADQVVADAAGVSRQEVGLYRRNHGIPAYDGFRTRGGGMVTPAVRSAPAVPAAPVAPALPPVAEPRRTVAPPAPVAPEAPHRAAMEPVQLDAATVGQPQPDAPRQGYSFAVVRTGDGAERRFCVMGATLADAVSRAELLLARRSDGPWVVRAVNYVADALE